MRSPNEWFKPERLTVLYFAYELIVLVCYLLGLGGLLLLGVFADAPLVVLGLFVAVPLVVFAYVAWWIPTFYSTARYRLTDEEVEYQRGVFFRQKTTVPFSRITNVNAAQGPIERLVGAGSVGVHTAGYGGQMGAELTIGAIRDFDDVKEQLVDHVRSHPSNTDGTGGDASEATAGDDGAMLRELRQIRQLLEADADD